MTMNYKKSFLALCIILFSLSVLGVSANDLNEDIAAPEDSDIIEYQDEDILSDDDDGTFTSLQQIINNSKENSTITLDKDYA